MSLLGISPNGGGGASNVDAAMNSGTVHMWGDTIELTSLTPNTVLVLNSSDAISSSGITTAELNTLTGINTSTTIQDQIDGLTNNGVIGDNIIAANQYKHVMIDGVNNHIGPSNVWTENSSGLLYAYNAANPSLQVFSINTNTGVLSASDTAWVQTANTVTAGAGTISVLTYGNILYVATINGAVSTMHYYYTTNPTSLGPIQTLSNSPYNAGTTTNKIYFAADASSNVIWAVVPGSGTVAITTYANGNIAPAYINHNNAVAINMAQGVARMAAGTTTNGSVLVIPDSVTAGKVNIINANTLSVTSYNFGGNQILDVAYNTTSQVFVALSNNQIYCLYYSGGYTSAAAIAPPTTTCTSLCINNVNNFLYVMDTTTRCIYLYNIVTYDSITGPFWSTLATADLVPNIAYFQNGYLFVYCNNDETDLDISVIIYETNNGMPPYLNLKYIYPLYSEPTYSLPINATSATTLPYICDINAPDIYLYSYENIVTTLETTVSVLGTGDVTYFDILTNPGSYYNTITLIPCDSEKIKFFASEGTNYQSWGIVSEIENNGIFAINRYYNGIFEGAVMQFINNSASSATVIYAADILPAVGNQYNIGSSSYYWNNTYFTNIINNGTYVLTPIADGAIFTIKNATSSNVFVVNTSTPLISNLINVLIGGVGGTSSTTSFQVQTTSGTSVFIVDNATPLIYLNATTRAETILPTSAAFSLGSSSDYWANVYFSKVNVNDYIMISTPTMATASALVITDNAYDNVLFETQGGFLNSPGTYIYNNLTVVSSNVYGIGTSNFRILDLNSLIMFNIDMINYTLIFENMSTPLVMMNITAAGSTFASTSFTFYNTTNSILLNMTSSLATFDTNVLIGGSSGTASTTSFQVKTTGNTAVFTVDNSTPSISLGANSTSAGNIVPTSTNTYNLGSPSAYWNNAYINNIIGTVTQPVETVSTNGAVLATTGYSFINGYAGAINVTLGTSVLGASKSVIMLKSAGNYVTVQTPQGSIFLNSDVPTANLVYAANPFWNIVSGNSYSFITSTLQQSFTPSFPLTTAPGSANNYGSSLALSADGNILAVGVSGYLISSISYGAIFVYNRTYSGTTATWTYNTALYYTGSGYATVQGTSVAMTPDGLYIASGAPGGSNGAVYMYYYTGGAWTYAAALTQGSSVDLGTSVSMTPNAQTVVSGDVTYATTGGIFIFTKTGTTSWTFTTIIVPSDYIGTSPNIGNQVSISANANTIAFGGYSDNSGVGAVWLYGYNKSSSTYTELTKILPTNPISTSPSFGKSLAMSGDGNTLLIGAPNDSSNYGAIYIWRNLNNFWMQISDRISNYVAEYFGSSLAITYDGTSAVIGAKGVATTGSIYPIVIGRNSYYLQSSLTATANTNQGFSVTISALGDTSVSGNNGGYVAAFV